MWRCFVWMRCGRCRDKALVGLGGPGARPTGIKMLSGDDEGGVFAAEGDAVADGVFDLHLAGLIGDVVEIAFGVRDLEIERGVHLVVAHAESTLR